MSLDRVNDKVFSDRMMGEGVTLQFEESQIVSPYNGIITMIDKLKYTISIKKNELGILFQNGLNMFMLDGQGFMILATENE
ncbi:PTS glucose transporter subunit IIA [Amphibacillus sp. Q70]|uniref:PTS glucose transporter subunit IIA n=1 Tax=Amphibacillus sp. Q70 TaxID=3453416 RepID=UPI003F84B733